jgi:hypothetical protein
VRQSLDPDWRAYAVPVRDVEELTGFNVFSSDLCERYERCWPSVRPLRALRALLMTGIARGMAAKAGRARAGVSIDAKTLEEWAGRLTARCG